jgi:hypothetical protein
MNQTKRSPETRPPPNHRESTFTHLDSGLLFTRQIKVSTPDTTRDLLPQPPALPFTLFRDWLDGNFLFGKVGIQEYLTGFRRSDVRCTCPLTLVSLDGGSVLGETGFERVGLAGEVAFAFVVDLDVSARLLQRRLT